MFQKIKMKKFSDRIKNILKKESNLIELKDFEKIVFVGDIHGDLQSSKKVISNYLKPENKIVFLGDYVDRGPNSKKNLDFLLKIKLENPNQVYLLQGNHEGYHVLRFSPADFWESLNKQDFKKYTSIVEKFPLVLITEDIIALHGVLPNVKNLNQINNIKLGDKQWKQICWGDFITKKQIGDKILTGRPQFDKNYFTKLMKRFNKKVLIRSHQPSSPLSIFNDRCLTIFTSSAYGQDRTVALVDKKKKIKTTKNLEIKKI